MVMTFGNKVKEEKGMLVVASRAVNKNKECITGTVVYMLIELNLKIGLK